MKVDEWTKQRSSLEKTFSCSHRLRQDGRHRNIAARKGLGRDEDVGFDAPVFAGEHLARAAQPGLHFVGNEERPVPVAELDGLRQVIVGRDEDPFPLNRLDDEAGDVAL